MLLALLAVTATPSNTIAEALKKKDPVVCQGDAVTGSRVARKPVCKKKSEWAKQAEESGAQFRRDNERGLPRR